MKQLSSTLPFAMCALLMFLSQPAAAEVRESTKTVGGTAVHYKTILPDSYDPAKAHPAVLVFGGGPQTMNTVDNTLNRNFRAEAEKRGYLVFGLAAPAGELFFESGDRIFPEFLKMVLTEYKVYNSKFHVAGPSNGGIAAMHIEPKPGERLADADFVEVIRLAPACSPAALLFR